MMMRVNRREYVEQRQAAGGAEGASAHAQPSGTDATAALDVRQFDFASVVVNKLYSG